MARRTPLGLELRGGVRQHPGAVSTQDDPRVERLEALRRAQAQQRVQADPTPGETEVADRSQRVRADEHALRWPPESDLAPAAPFANGDELERPERFSWDDVMRNAEPGGERRAVAIVPVEELDHADRRADRADAFLDAVSVHRIDEPNITVRDKRVRAALQEPLLDPAEARLELVYRFHFAAQRSKPGKSFARAAAISSSTSNGMRQNSTAKCSSSTSAYSQNGSNGTSSSGSLCSHTSPALPTLSQSTRPTRRSHCRCT